MLISFLFLVFDACTRTIEEACLEKLRWLEPRLGGIDVERQVIRCLVGFALHRVMKAREIL